MTFRVRCPGYLTVEREMTIPGNAADWNFQMHRPE
jgi:hypothetical protein